MQYIVYGYGNNVLDMCVDVVENPEEAFYKADEFIDAGYDVEIKRAIVREYDEWTTNYNELQYLFKKHNSYEEFENNVDTDIIKYLRKHNLMEYVANHYEENNDVCDIIMVPDCIKIPVDKDTFVKLNELAKTENETIVQYVSKIIMNI